MVDDIKRFENVEVDIFVCEYMYRQTHKLPYA